MIYFQFIRTTWHTTIRFIHAPENNVLFVRMTLKKREKSRNVDNFKQFRSSRFNLFRKIIRKSTKTKIMHFIYFNFIFVWRKKRENIIKILENYQCQCLCLITSHSTKCFGKNRFNSLSIRYSFAPRSLNFRKNSSNFPKFKELLFSLAPLWNTIKWKHVSNWDWKFWTVCT